jgi:hypothetical protein
MIEENIRRKIQDLVGRSTQLVSASGGSGLPRDRWHQSECEGWITETLNVIELAVPIPGNSYRRRAETITGSGDFIVGVVGSMGQLLRALLPDIDAGLLGNFGNKIRAETFDDFLDHAEAYRKEGQKQAAGVLAGVVFEDTIRRICRDKGINERGEDLDKLISALARQTVISGQQSKQARVAAHVRGKATHAEWDGYDMEGVADTIQITRTFLREHLGG